MEQLEKTGAAENTIVVLWGDHGWHLGEHAVWGKHTLFEESLRSPLIVSYRGIKRPGESTDSMVETLDVFPTLCDLAGLPMPDFVDGVSLRPLLDDPASPGHPAIAYSRSARTIRTETHRLIVHNDGYAELYDHTSAAKETKNVAGTHASLVRAAYDASSNDCIGKLVQQCPPRVGWLRRPKSRRENEEAASSAALDRPSI